MNVFVCVKQIPDPNAPGKFDPATRRLVRDGVDVVLDPGDEHAVEAGLQLAEQQGGDVTVVSMGPPKAMDAIRKALSMGGARGINEPRYPSRRGIMQSKSKEVKQVGLAELALDGPAGTAALTQEVVAITPAETRKAGQVIEDRGEGAKQIADFLARLKVI